MNMPKDADLSFPIPRTSPLDPPPDYARLREENALSRVRLWNGSSAWIATRYEDIRSILRDPRFAADGTLPGYPMLSPAREAALTVKDRQQLGQIDPPAHTRLRTMLAPEFTIKRIEAMRPFVKETIAGLIDAMIEKGPPLDFVEHFALKLPSTVIATMLGVPYEDHDFFEECSAQRVALDLEPEVILRAGQQLTEFCDRLLRQKEADPGEGDDLLSRLVVNQVRPGHLSHDEAVWIAVQLVQAGHETTGNQIGLGTLNLMQNPDQLKALLEDPSRVQNAVEEMLRYNTVIHYSIARVALEDVEIGGQLIRKGEGLFALLIGANRDPSAFSDPDGFDISRQARGHVAFSYGIHICLGAPLARLELQEVFSTLFQRLPNLRLAVPVEELSFKHDNMVYGVKELPVSW